MASALAKLERPLEARESYEQAKQIYEVLELDFRVDQCNIALDQISESIHRTSSRRRLQQSFWFCFLMGLAIVLLIWWLKR